LKRPAGFEPKLIVEHPSCSLVDPQRVRLPLGPVQGEHELAIEDFTQGVLSCERVKSRDHFSVAAKHEARINEHLKAFQSCFVQPGDE
jgi:hypothetical protein